MNSNCRTTDTLPAASHILDAPLIHEQPSTRMHLSASPKSDAAIRGIANLAAGVIQLKGRQTAPSPEYLRAVGAIVGDLFKAASSSPVRVCVRPLRCTSFVGGPVGYGPFKRALDDLARSGFVRVDKGHQGSQHRPAMLTRIRITPKLTDFFGQGGITPTNRRSHFSYKRSADDVPPIQLRARSIRKKAWVKRGRQMRVDWADPAVIERANHIRKLNDFLAKQDITGPVEADLDDLALYRCFNDGDQDGHDYRKGGRTYAGFQTLPRNERAKIKINGRDTVEVDIGACFLTIAHYLLGRSFDSRKDAYQGTNLPREIVKAWVNLTISASKPPYRWPSKTLAKLAEKGFHDVAEAFPIRQTEREVLAAIPIVQEWCDSPFDWSDLHFIESEIMVEAMSILALGYGIPALPVHDALLVPHNEADWVKTIIQDTFRKHTGILPKVG